MVEKDSVVSYKNISVHQYSSISELDIMTVVNEFTKIAILFISNLLPEEKIVKT